MREILRAENVYFSYKKEDGSTEEALKNICLRVAEGELVAIVGHNGSGKSTLAKLINGLNVPDSGNVFIYDMDTADEDNLLNIRETVGMVFQNPDNQLVATVVDEDVAFGPENLGVPQPEIVERVQEALAAVGMTEFAKRAPHMLSGGQKQRVAIAGALAIHPKMIVFDEATAMLDPKGRAEVVQTMRQLNAQGMTILFITHFMEEVACADRVIVMSDGVIIKEGTPKEILSDVETLDAAYLLPPFPVSMANALRKEGVMLAKDAITTEELVEEICRWR